jgi:RimJ/RimL family protein N-acetyltransferase
MKFIRYGIALERLQTKHLELVRGWRNDDSVRLRMQYQETITPEAQTEWFNKLDDECDWYFIAFRKEIPFGLFHIKWINWQTKTGEAGGFVGDSTLIGGVEPALAILALMDFAFFSLHLSYLEAKYHSRYEAITALNRQLGYEVIAQGEDGFVRTHVGAERYLEAAESFRKAAERLSA